MRDERFAGYDAQVRPSPKLAGAYHFCWIGDFAGVRNTPQQEAANFAAAVRASLRPGFLLACDWESHRDAQGRTVDHTHRTDWAVDFALEVRKLTGRTPVLYANWSTLNRHDWSRWRAEIGTAYWLAGGTKQYAQRTDGYTPGEPPRNPDGWGDPIIWQYTEHGYLPGWDGRLDLNEFRGTAADWRALADGTVTPPKAPSKETAVKYMTLRGFRLDEQSYWTHLERERYARLKGWCKQTLDLYQGVGGSSRSGGTHLPPGGATDYWPGKDPEGMAWFDRNGGCGAFVRGFYGDDPFELHMHSVTNRAGVPALYQVTALNGGRNGLANNGRDTSPRSGVRWPLRSWQDGLAWQRAENDREEARQQAARPAAMRAMPQSLQDFWNGWLAVDRWDNADQDPKDVVLYGISDADLIARLEAKGFVYYGHADVHERARYLLADFVQGMALENTERNDDEVAWDVLNRVIDPPEPGVTWVELRPVFSAAHAGGAFGKWGEDRTRHSVRAMQAGLNHLSGATLLVEDGIFGKQTRAAVSNFQVNFRGALPQSPASDGVPGVHDFLHLVRLCSERTGRTHRARFLF